MVWCYYYYRKNGIVLIFGKSLIAFFIATTPLFDDAWVSVPRPQKIPYQIEEDDRSIWVVFAKTFGGERVLIRFPDDPIYRRKADQFIASSPWMSQGEFSLIVRKKTSGPVRGIQEVVYRDSENRGRWVRERHLESKDYHYVLRMSHPNDNIALFNQFAGSFEIEKNSDFHR